MTKLSHERVLKALVSLGLSQVEARVYVYLASEGPQKVENIAKTLKLDKQHLHSTMKSLQNKRIVNATLEYSAQFSALPFEIALDSLVEAKRKKVQRIEENKEEIISYWRSMIARDATTR
jgi:sugar-specific transcriptional regulator TrmB